MGTNLGAIVTGAIFILNILLAAAAAWIGLMMQKAIAAARKEIDTQIEGVGQKVEALNAKIDSKVDRQSREFGETVAAMREKMRELELYCRDTFVRRDGFYQVKAELSSDIKAMVGMIGSLGSKIDARLERMEQKIDNNR
jgi:hypothetical protein